ncbi:DUF6438 domain-containing protein [Flavobacterium selenitireducens]|uniref:DUF6438 domain-containing protein n=1 Tax=Flavobacterium selenitireducens TaxID=2722704 RepID=UPI00168AF50E|nr:DUF6438 domain-containing protein [Flavobacterium selenitireducens]MBD3583049.1 hypothetical protein [Flavobacterium selenitireducens]
MKQKILMFILAIAALSGSCLSKRHTPGFEKIVFHTTGCFGFCPTYHLEVGAERQLRLHVESAYRPQSSEVDSARIGFYEGTLDEAMFARLMTELKKVKFAKLQLQNTNCCDGVLKTIIIYREGRREVIREMFPPKELEALIKVLYEICEVGNLKRVAPFQLENVPNPHG